MHAHLIYSYKMTRTEGEIQINSRVTGKFRIILEQRYNLNVEYLHLIWKRKIVVKRIITFVGDFFSSSCSVRYVFDGGLK
jgi:hypothetical protein